MYRVTVYINFFNLLYNSTIYIYDYNHQIQSEIEKSTKKVTEKITISQTTTQKHVDLCTTPTCVKTSAVVLLNMDMDVSTTTT